MELKSFTTNLLLVVLLTLLVSSVSLQQTHFTQDMVDSLNEDPSVPWEAANYDQFAGKSFEELGKYLGGNRLPTSEEARYSTRDVKSTLAIPETFDSRMKWPQCIHGIRNQGSCGSCWAFATTGVFSDRLCITTNNVSTAVVSPQFLIECDKKSYACKGGYGYYSWTFFMNTGIPSDACVPYTKQSFVDGTTTNNQCQSTCTDGSALKFYKAASGYTLYPPISNFQTEIMTKGPMEADFGVYSDFYSYKSGIYQKTPGSTYVGGHAVKVLGWGVDANSVPYWIAQNQWGAYWGMSGYFYIYRGNTTLNAGFDSYMIAGTVSAPTCYGKAQTDSSACSGNGKCVGPDTCSCSSGWGGDYCNITSCNGIVPSNPNVCSGHGTCTGAETCVCNSGWTGTYCAHTTCNGILSSNSSVCSGRGTCTTKDTCTCSTGYGDQYCQSFICYGLTGSNAAVCNGHGTCSGYNYCKCNTGYSGSQCANYTCNGVGQNVATVCNSHGSCVDYNTCKCTPGYTGQYCSQVACNGILPTDASVCSGRGKCIGPNSCTCSNSTQWGGSFCEVPKCGGILATDSSVCGGKTNYACSAVNTCTCKIGYSGSDCSTFSCFGIDSNSASVCSGKGKCIAVDTCTCTNGATATNCASNSTNTDNAGNRESQASSITHMTILFASVLLMIGALIF